MARVSVMYSGSSGNCALIGSENTYILIDAGVSAKRICDGLREREADIDRIGAIFITHAHKDHIKGLSVLEKSRNIPVFMTEGTYCEAAEQGMAADENKITLIKAGDHVDIGKITVTPFNTMHDAKGSVGYVARLAEGVSIGYATDMGKITEEVENALTGCDLTVIESNHDINMLKNGPYPYCLKQRILGDFGHLSNDSCAKETVKLAKTGTTRFILGHLSSENNFPGKALSATESRLKECGLERGRDYLLECACRSGGKIHIF